jgi:hypothetical protein
LEHEELLSIGQYALSSKVDDRTAGLVEHAVFQLPRTVEATAVRFSRIMHAFNWGVAKRTS